MPKKIDLTGMMFGRLTAMHSESYGPIGNKVVIWTCICTCGREARVPTGNLTTGNSQSCGCFSTEKTRESNAKRKGIQRPAFQKKGRNTRTYAIWRGIKTRCTNSNRHDFEYYGARGIGLCTRWLSFDAFLLDMGEAPKDFTIERLDNKKGYEPGNCVWASRQSQSQNTSRCRLNAESVREIRRLTADGHTRQALAQIFGVSASTVSQVVTKRAWKNVL